MKILKDYIVSSLVTFVAVFAADLAMQLQSGALTPENFTTATVLGVGMVAVRAAFKVVIESLPGIKK